MNSTNNSIQLEMIVMNNPSSPSFYFANENSELVDDDDDCIICGKLLLDHSEDEANQCYSNLIKKQLFKKQLSKRKVKT